MRMCLEFFFGSNTDIFKAFSSNSNLFAESNAEAKQIPYIHSEYSHLDKREEVGVTSNSLEFMCKYSNLMKCH